MNSTPVHLICASNRSWIMPLSVMLSSVVDHFSKGRDLVIHIISNDATAQDRDNVRESIRLVRPQLDRIDIQWYAIDAPLLDKINTREQRLSRDVFARLFAPYLLPETCERAIYLDSDMVVLADIAQLFDSTADSPALLHAVHDLATPRVSSEGGVFDYLERGIPADTRMFNSGCLVINLKQWSERDLTPPILAYLEKFGDRVNWVDQGAMNAFLYNDWVPLDLRWNQTTPVLYLQPWLRNGYTRRDWVRLKNDPYIVHYSGRKKPWEPEWRTLPRRAYFFRALQKTVFRNTVPGEPRLESIVGPRLYYYLWRLRMKISPRRTPKATGAIMKSFSHPHQTFIPTKTI